MVSASSSRASSPEFVETTQVFIKTVVGDSTSSYSQIFNNATNIHITAIPVTVPSTTSISDLISLVSERTLFPERELRLVYGGKHLAPTSTLESNHILKDSTIYLALPIRGGMPPKKVRCTHHDCKSTAQRIVGDCGFCNGHFCEKHRLLEDHKCSGLEDVSSPIPSAHPSSPTPASAFCFDEKKVQWWLVGLSPELLTDMDTAV